MGNGSGNIGSQFGLLRGRGDSIADAARDLRRHEGARAGGDGNLDDVWTFGLRAKLEF